MEFINKTLTLDCKGKTHSILVCEDHVPDSNNLQHNGMEDYSFIETCYSAEAGNKPEMESKGKEDDDEVAKISASFGAELACTKEEVQRKEPIHCQLGDEVDTVIEETAFEADSSRDEACVKEPLRDKSVHRDENNDDGLRDAEQVFSPGCIRSINGSGEGFGPSINLDVVLAQLPNKNPITDLPPKPIEHTDTSLGGKGILALCNTNLQSTGPMIKMGPYGKSILTQKCSSQYSPSASSNLLLRKEKQKGKMKSHLEGFTSSARLHVFTTAAASKHSKSAIFRPAAATFAQSDLSERASPLNNYLLSEAKATLQLGKTLGINYNGEVDVVISRIVDLELKDNERINKGGKAQQ
ncbi:hypothetical protein CsSME_00035911 [Camellia sinensis var. sinensis]